MLNKVNKSALAYIAESTQNLIEETGVDFESEESFRSWCDENVAKIAQGASKLQQDFIRKVNKHEEKVKRVLADKIYFEIHRREMKKREIEAYNEALS